MTEKTSIYASYGIIMKELQNTELLFTQMLYSVNMNNGKIESREKVKKIYSNCLKDNFSFLVKKLKDLAPESNLLLHKDDYIELNHIVKLRNHYAHTFFKEFTSFDDQNQIQRILEGNKFAFNQIKDFNILLQNRLRSYLRTMNLKMNEIEDSVMITTENWESIVNP